MTDNNLTNSMDVKAANAWLGTGIFAAIALVVSVTLTVYVGLQTKDKTQVGTNRA